MVIPVCDGVEFVGLADNWCLLGFVLFAQFLLI